MHSSKVGLIMIVYENNFIKTKYPLYILLYSFNFYYISYNAATQLELSMILMSLMHYTTH